MDDVYLLIDFGSTYTKVVAVDLDREVVLGRSQAPSTVRSHMLEGLRRALSELRFDGRPVPASELGRAKKLASSSAAGGLCVVAVGLVPDLTLEAARKAALGAGAKIVGSYAYELDEEAVGRIEASGCDLVLLTGGIDGGNKRVLLHNAAMLAASSLHVPVVVAGNRAARSRARELLQEGGKHVEVTENVLPELDRLEVDAARACIRELFMRNIVRAKGLDQAEEYIGRILMPTPLATLKAASLLAGGHGGEAGLGELMVVEVGGATTNVHSAAAGVGSGTAVLKGIPDPYEMRTVEGDLGIRYNAATIVGVLGAEATRDNTPEPGGVTAAEVAAAASRRSGNVAFLPDSPRELAIDAGLARSAVGLAVERHAGTIREVWGVDGPVRIQRGKDLTGLRTVIGTGGVFAYNPHREWVLEASLATRRSPFSLRPAGPELFVDGEYVLYGLGLLATVAPAGALRLGKKSLTRIR